MAIIETKAASSNEEFQRFADARIAPQFRQPLKTVEEATLVNGWEFTDHPVCCGEPVQIRGFLGCADVAECLHCGLFVARANAPEFGNSWVDLPTIAEPEDGRVWIAGRHETRAAITKATGEQP